MEFTLCYKAYKYKPSLKAMKEFKEATGKDLWSSIVNYMLVFTRAQSNNWSTGEMLHELAKVLDFVDAAQLFYCLAKQENSKLTLAEIEDAMFNVGILPTEKEHDKSEPYPFVLFLVASEINSYHEEIQVKKKQ